MSSTFATRLSEGDARAMRLVVTVEGIGDAFQGDSIDVPSTVLSSTYTRRKMLLSVPEIGEDRLDLIQRRMIGGSMTVRLLDDDSGTLRAMFTPRRRRRTFLTSTVTSSTTTITVDSTANVTSATTGTIYIGGETITFTGRTATQFTGCTRGAFGSMAEGYQGDASEGTSVYDRAPAWLGRRVTLTAYFTDEVGASSAALSQVLGVYRLEESPAFVGRDTWELRCSTLADEVAAKAIFAGVEPIEQLGSNGFPQAASGFINSMQYGISSDDEQRFAVGGTTSHVLVKLAEIEGGAQEGHALYRLESVDATSSPAPYTSRVRVTFAGDSTGFSANYQLAIRKAVSIQPAVLLNDAMSTIVGKVLCSRYGDGTTSATYDSLPGKAPSSVDGLTWRMGAAIRETEIAISSFAAITAEPWSYCLTRTMTAGDFLRDVCLEYDCVWYIDTSGKVSVRRLAEDGASSTFTIGSSTLLREPTIVADEENIVPRMQLRCNYNAFTDEYEMVINDTDKVISDRYPHRDDVVEIESRSIYVPQIAHDRYPYRPRHARDPYRLPDLLMRLRRMQAANGRPNAILQCECVIDALTVTLGDVVTLSSLALPDLEGGQTLNGFGRIIAKGVDLARGIVRLTVQVIDQLFRISPAATISAWTPGTNVITLDASNFLIASGTSNVAQALFAVGDSVTLWDVSAQAIGATPVISGVSGNNVTLSIVPPFTIETGIDYITLSSYPSSAGANASGYTDLQYLNLNRDNEYSDVIVTRWR